MVKKRKKSLNNKVSEDKTDILKRVLYRINHILFYGLLLLGIVYIFFYENHTNIILFAFGSFLASWALSYYMKKRRLENYEIFINIVLWVNLLGEVTFYYGGVPYYDKILHFLVGLLIAVITFENFHKNLKLNFEMVFFAVLGMLGIWEIYEYILQVYLGYPTMGVVVSGITIQSAIDDTMIDLIFGTIGSLVYIVFKNFKKN